MALDPSFLFGLAELVLKPLFALVVDGPLQRDLAGQLVADLVKQILQEECPCLCEQKAFLETRPELKSVLVIYHGHLLKGMVQLAQIEQTIWLHMLA